MSWRSVSRASVAAVLVVAAFASVAPGRIAGHASLISSDPYDGDVIDLPDAPREITAIFGDILDPASSRLELRSLGRTVAVGGVEETGSPFEMRLVPPSLEHGLYEVRYVAVTADDGFMERGTFTFTIVGRMATDADLTPAPEPTASASPTPVAPSATAVAPPTAIPTPSAPGGPGGGTGGGDLLLPVLGLAALLALGTVLVMRRPRSRTDGP